MTVAVDAPTPLRLRTNLLWTLLSNGTYNLAQLGMVVVLAKLTRDAGKELIGVYELALALATPVVALSSLQLRTAIATDRRREFHFGHYLALRIIGTGAAALVICGLSLARGGPPLTVLVLVVLGLLRCVDALSDIVHGLFQQHERMDLSAKRQLGRALGALAILALALAALRGRLSPLATLLCAALALLVFSVSVLLGWEYHAAGKLLRRDLEAAAPVRPLWERSALKRLAWLTLPLGISVMLVTFTSSIPRLLTEHYLGVAALGVLGPLLYLPAVGQLLVGSFGLAAGPRLADSFLARDLQAFDRLVLQMTVFAALLGGAGLLVAVLFGRVLLTWVYRPEYAEFAPVLVVLMAAGAISLVASVLGFSVTATRRFHAQIWGLAVTALAALAAGIVLIPRFGLPGAAYAVSVAATVQVLTLWVTLVALRRACRPEGGATIKSGAEKR
ncbi:MAG TPA: oligosaccharide flippase family protein [Phycisphaerae bacterium]|jgi:O-antigen/teichoic acid export membrane protein